jgi:selenocysteine lyase/cysteine desulfurase
MGSVKIDSLSGYFINHTVGVFPGQEQAIQDVMGDYAAAWCDPVNGQWDYLMQCREEFLNKWGKLLNVDSSTICSMENVTTAVFALLGSLPHEYLRDRVVLIAANCFPSLYFLLDGLQERYGFVLRTVYKEHKFHVSDQAFLDAWDEDVTLAILTWVSSTTSHKIDLRRLIAHSRKMNSLTCLDITQGAGIIPIDLDDADVDFAVTTSLKWSCGAPGAGLLYVKPDKLRDCEPELRGWFSQENPFSWDLDLFQYSNTTNRFLNGTPSFLPCCASLPGLRWLAETGQSVVLEHNRRLCSQIIDQAVRMDWNLLTPIAEEERGGSLMFELPSNVDIYGLMSEFERDCISVDVRGQILRMSPGYTTTESAVSQLCAHLKRVFNPACFVC